MSFASLSALATRGRLTADAVSGVLVLGAMAGTGVAVAKIPSSSTGQITACVAEPSGTTRIINAQKGKKCRAGENTISWSRGWSYRGGWRSTTSYKVCDVVLLSGGTSYLARKRSKAAKPGVATTVWVPLSTAGANGASGAVGATGAQGSRVPTGHGNCHGQLRRQQVRGRWRGSHSRGISGGALPGQHQQLDRNGQCHQQVSNRLRHLHEHADDPVVGGRTPPGRSGRFGGRTLACCSPLTPASSRPRRVGCDHRRRWSHTWRSTSPIV